jgi:hypothetical protein
VTVDGVRVGQALTDGQGVARLDYTIPTGFDGSRMTVRFTDESGASAISSIEVTEQCLAADLDCNGSVDSGDVALLLIEFGPCAGCTSDLDASGMIDFGDVAMLMLDWTS